MIQKGKMVSKILLLILAVSVLVTSMALTAFAASDANYTVDANGKLTKIMPKAYVWDSGISLSIPSAINGKNIQSIGPKVISYKEGAITAITIPSSVKSIDSGAFSNCSNLKTVTINNYDGAVSVASGAFPSSASITYTQEKPTTTAPATTTTKAPATTATKAPATTAAPATTKAPVATTKAPVATTKAPVTTTQPVEETTAEPTTGTDLSVIILDSSEVEITDATPFADAKEQLSDMNVWDQLVNQTTAPVEQSVRKIDPVKATASYAAVVLVAFSAVTLGYFKFKN